MTAGWILGTVLLVALTALLLVTSARILADQDEPYARPRGERPRG